MKHLKALFLDREGILTPKLAQGEYVLRRDQAVVDPEVLRVLGPLSGRGIDLFVVTNQSCVARGLISLEDAWSLHETIIAGLNEGGVRIKDSRLCPHRDQDGCICRKPLPGMLRDLADVHGLDMSEAAMIGDSVSDIKAGSAAGCAVSLLVDSAAVGDPETTVKNMSQAVERLKTHFDI